MSPSLTRRSRHVFDRGAGVRHPRRCRPGPGGPEEDTEGGFQHGGWQFDYDDGTVAAWEKNTEALLLGRRTYELFAGSWGVWPEDADGLQGELTRRYNRIPKYVASRSLTEVGWTNSYLLGPDVPGAVERLRGEPGGEIRVWGSTELIRTLAEHDQIDEYRLLVHPLVLGVGKKLFGDGFPTPGSRSWSRARRPPAS
ncbi:dihydrofolate reductase family protein [Leifsonia sp. L25]|uniref:dihydrofolate reductase family protein n=1 Tax=Leifsonia sp. L25 TaxID=3423957 RepID=UPI003D69A6F7